MLVIIPARGGSKGVPKKNIKLLGDKPLIQYTIDAAIKIFNKRDIIVSTDSIEISNIVEEKGLKVPFLRPSELATDEAGSNEVLLHALSYYEKLYKKCPEIIILLQPTSPFRSAENIIEALQLYNDSLDMVVSVKETSANPYYVLREENSLGFLEISKKGNFTRRQDCPKVWEINGAIYIINAKSLKAKPISSFDKIIKYEMNDIESHDIDTMYDWIVAESILKFGNIV